MGFEASNFEQVPQKESEMPVTPETGNSATNLNEWVEKQLSDLMLRRIAGEDVDLITDLPKAPENLVQEANNKVIEDSEKISDDYIHLMREALDHPSADNFYSVWLESQGEDAKNTLRKILENPDRIKQEIKKHIEQSNEEDKEKIKNEEILKSPFERVSDKLRDVQIKLEQEGLTDDSSHIEGLIKKLKEIDDSGYETTIELWYGESIPSDNSGWYPSEKVKEAILEALGTNYKRTNSQFDDLDINYYGDQFHTERVKLEIRENKVPVGQALFSKATLVFPGQWYKEKK